LSADEIQVIVTNLSRLDKTETDAVVRGHCVDFYDTLYSQGGTGTIFSRAASARLAHGHREMIGMWKEAEDISLGAYMKAKGIQLPDTADPHFLGLGWTNVEKLNDALAEIAHCPLVDVNARDCRMNFVAPVREIVFYHAQGGRPGNIDALQVSQRLFNMTPSVWWR
jgi:hypothetical protein